MPKTSASALLIVDPYNDFFSVFGKAWPIVRPNIKKANLFKNLRATLSAARSKNIQIAFAPHYRYKKQTAPRRKFLHPGQYMQSIFRPFAADTFGGKFHHWFTPKEGEIIASEHACSSGFIGTDLDEKLRAAGVDRIYIAGLLSNTCIESTARSAVDLGYHVSVINDCIASWSDEDHAAAVDNSYHNVIHDLISTADFQARIAKAEAANA